MKRILIALLAAATVLGVTACGNTPSKSEASAPSSETSSESSSEAPSEDTSSESSSEAPEAPSGGEAQASVDDVQTFPVPDGATDDEKAYIEQLNVMLPALATNQGVDMNAAASDPDAAMKMLEDVKASYGELAALKAPEKYAGVQAKFAEGANAMVEYLDYTLEMSNMNPEEITEEKQQEAVTKMTELSTTAINALAEASGVMMEGADAEAASGESSEAASDAGEAPSAAE